MHYYYYTIMHRKCFETAQIIALTSILLVLLLHDLFGLFNSRNCQGTWFGSPSFLCWDARNNPSMWSKWSNASSKTHTHSVIINKHDLYNRTQQNLHTNSLSAEHLNRGTDWSSLLSPGWQHDFSGLLRVNQTILNSRCLQSCLASSKARRSG